MPEVCRKNGEPFWLTRRRSGAMQFARQSGCCRQGVVGLRAGLLILATYSVGLADVGGSAASSPSGAVDTRRLAVIDEIVDEGIRYGKMRGCVVVVGHRGVVVHRKAYGLRTVEPIEEPMTLDTVFDLASLTKPTVTAACVMQLVEGQQLQLDHCVSQYLPEFTGHGKEAITVAQLLTHQSGLIADNALADYLDGPDAAWEKICQLDLVAEPGAKFIYSDVGFVVLGQLAERISGQPLADLATERLFRPLGMSETGFNPPSDRRARCAPTEKQGERWLRGTVHDPRARELGGVAGHAGLFSNADDLAIYCRMLLAGGTSGQATVFRPETIRLMNTPQQTSGGLRNFGWDKRSAYSSNRGDLMSSSAFGHGGFTGTALWVDPELQLFVIFLSSRLHPDGSGSVNPLAGRIATVAAAAIIPQ